jgi:hypothetical protein
MKVLEKKANAFDAIASATKTLPNNQDLGEWLRQYMQTLQLSETTASSTKTILHG